MTDPTSPASAPPPIDPIPLQRVVSVLHQYGVEVTNSLCVEALAGLCRELHAEGWNAALAMQQNLCPWSGTVCDCGLRPTSPCPRLAAQPPEPVPQIETFTPRLRAIAITNQHASFFTGAGGREQVTQTIEKHIIAALAAQLPEPGDAETVCPQCRLSYQQAKGCNCKFTAGFEAALAAQPPEPTKELVHPLTGDMYLLSTRTGRIIERREGAPPQPQETQDADRHGDLELAGRALDDAGHHVSGVVRGADSNQINAPPEPGDAGKLAWLRKLRDEAPITYSNGVALPPIVNFQWIDVDFLFQQLDAAQSALTEEKDAREKRSQWFLASSLKLDEVRQELRLAKECEAAFHFEVRRAQSALAESQTEAAILVQQRNEYRSQYRRAQADFAEWRERYHAVVAERDELLSSELRMQKERDESRAEVERLTELSLTALVKKLQHGNYEHAMSLRRVFGDPRQRVTVPTDAARLRSPTATGEDREAARRMIEAATKKRPGWSSPWIDIDVLAEHIAAARAQGVREERARIEAAIGAAPSLDENGYICEKAALLRALAAPEAQEIERALAATGEDDELARNAIAEWQEKVVPEGWLDEEMVDLRGVLIPAFAAARAQGVREGIEKAVQEFPGIAPALRALVATEPQEDGK